MKRFSLVCLLSVAMISGAFSSVQAQDNLILGVDEDLWVTSTTTTSTAISVGAGVLTLNLVRDSSAAIEVYIENNAVAIQHDLYMGGGETARDLASLFFIPDDHSEAFVDLLFEHREQLATASGLHFIEVVVENMLHDEDLATHALRWISS